MTEFNQACGVCFAGGVSEDREREIGALILRDWSVRVLDAECATEDGCCAEVADTAGGGSSHDTRWHCTLTGINSKSDARKFYGRTADAARLAAAEAVFPELPADVRAAIGERP